jgi:hypothetical protein
VRVPPPVGGERAEHRAREVADQPGLGLAALRRRVEVGQRLEAGRRCRRAGDVPGRDAEPVREVGRGQAVVAPVRRGSEQARGVGRWCRRPPDGPRTRSPRPRISATRSFAASKSRPSTLIATSRTLSPRVQVQRARPRRASQRQDGWASAWSGYGQRMCGRPSRQGTSSASRTSVSRPRAAAWTARVVARRPSRPPGTTEPVPDPVPVPEPDRPPAIDRPRRAPPDAG